MKKQNLMKAFLILLPILAAMLAVSEKSVTVFDANTGVTEYYSYLEPLNVGSFQMITPLAAMLCLASGILSGAYIALKKQGLLKAVAVVSFCAATVAVIPTLMSTDVKVIPHVGLPILMGLECLEAYYLTKKPASKPEPPKGPRLK